MLAQIAIVAGRYPCWSETFVRREVAGLSSVGCQVATISLRGGDADGAIPAPDHVIYRGIPKVLAAALAEVFRSPLRTAMTVGSALRDMAWPGEPMAIRGRVLLPLQAIVAAASAKVLREAGVEHIHCHFAHAPTTVGMYLARHLGVTFSFVGHANDLFQRRSLLTRKLQRAKFVSCISQWHRDLYCSIHPAGVSKYKVIRCGVDTGSWVYREPRETSRLHVICVGRLVEKKGIDTLLRAAGLLYRAGCDFIEAVTIAGDGPEAGKLMRLADTEGISGRVNWLGAVDNECVRKLLGQSDLFILPCREDSKGDRDGIPVVLMEAMACGVPVISGDLPAIRELVIDGQTGRLVDGRFPERLAETISQLASSVEVRRQLACAAAAHVESEFSLKRNLQRLREAIQQAVVTHGEGCQR